MDTICLCKAFHKEDDLAPNYNNRTVFVVSHG